jgi:hypothetical protein
LFAKRQPFPDNDLALFLANAGVFAQFRCKVDSLQYYDLGVEKDTRANISEPRRRFPGFRSIPKASPSIDTQGKELD